MGCLKCGANTADKQVFCDACLEVMQRYPVKPDTAVHIPHRDPAVHEKKPAPRREPTAGEQLAQLRRMIRWLIAVIAVLSVLLCLTGVLLIHTLNSDTVVNPIGKNYTTDNQQRP